MSATLPFQSTSSAAKGKAKEDDAPVAFELPWCVLVPVLVLISSRRSASSLAPSRCMD